MSELITETTSLSLGDLFNEISSFVIPKYQRGYSWERKQLDEFMFDILNCVEKNRKHYMGTLYLEKKDNSYVIIDGQQRLTTILIFISALIDTCQDDEKKQYLYNTYIKTGNTYKILYEGNHRANQFFQNKVLEPLTTGNPGIQNIYEKKQRYAKKYFIDFLRKNTDYEKTIKIIQNNLKYTIQLISEKDFNINIIFETLNNRGKPLSLLEKLKNRLIYLESFHPFTSNNVNVSDIWLNLYTALGGNKNHLFKEDEMLTAHLTVYRKPTHEAFSERGGERKLFQMFCETPEKFEMDEDKDVDSIDIAQDGDTNLFNALVYPDKSWDDDPDKITNYTTNLLLFCKSWCEVLDLDNNELPEIIRQILILNSEKTTKALLTVIHMKFLEQRNGFCNEEIEIFNMIENILFRQSIPNNGAWCKTNKSFGFLARDLNYGFDYDLHKEYEQEDNSEEQFNAPYTIDNLRQELIDALDNTYVTAESLKNAFYPLFYAVYGQKKGFYKWSQMKYFLFLFEDELRRTAPANQRDNLITFKDFSNYSIEHIFPESCEKDNLKDENGNPIRARENWKDLVSSIESVRSSSEEKNRDRIIIIHTLGNLTLLKNGKEQKLSDYKSWEDKKRIYNSRQIYHTHNTKDLIRNYGDGNWDVKAIQKRGNIMLKLLCNKLGIENLTPKEKAEILFPSSRIQKKLLSGRWGAWQ